MNGPIRSALAPVIAAMTAAAETGAAQEMRAAAQLAAQTVDKARVQTDGILAEAARQGRADAAGVAAAETARGHREARAIELAARREVYEHLVSVAQTGVARLMSEPDYPHWRDTLVATARRSLGSPAVIRDAPGGGISASIPGRRLDLRLRDFADLAVAEVAGEPELLP